jgi:hypothetical protein
VALDPEGLAGPVASRPDGQKRSAGNTVWGADGNKHLALDEKGRPSPGPAGGARRRGVRPLDSRGTIPGRERGPPPATRRRRRARPRARR